ncbi:MAG: hypothetical protein K6B75_00645 [Lachnospiraceae bacterium]|nr:hypothetical protein [Lachnospiraceae bacterium]
MKSNKNKRNDRKIVDYSKLRFNNICSKEYRHLFLLLGWVGYFLAYFLTENLIPVSKCHLVHSRIDDLIPFNEFFVVFYVFWYILVFGSLLYFLLYDVESFKGLQIFIIVTQVIATIVYIVWPSVQDLRPAEFERENFFTWILSIIYAADTPTGVCPSLHVAYSLGILSAWLKRKETGAGFKIFVAVSVVFICMSVNFVKQHSFLDVVWAIPVGVVAECFTYGKTYWLPRLKRTKD